MKTLNTLTNGRTTSLFGIMFCVACLHLWATDQTLRQQPDFQVRREQSSLTTGGLEIDNAALSQNQLNLSRILSGASGLLVISGIVLLAVHNVFETRRLRTSQNEAMRFAALFAEPTDATLTLDEHGVVVACNARAENLFGYSSSDLKGKSFEELVTPGSNGTAASLSKPQSLIQRLRSEVIVRKWDALARSGTGHRVPIEVSAVRVDETDNGRIAVVIRNVNGSVATERTSHQTQDTLVRTHNELSGLNWLHDQLSRCRTFEEVGACLSREAVQIVEISSIQLWRRVSRPPAAAVAARSANTVANKASMNQTTSLPLGGAIDEDVWERMGTAYQGHLASSSEAIPVSQSVLSNLTPSEGCLTLNDISGVRHRAEQIWARAHGLNSLAAFHLSVPDSCNYAMIAYDTSELHPSRVNLLALISRIAAGALHRIDQATSIYSGTRARADFLAHISHAFRTPLSSILGFSEMLAEEVGLDRAPPHRRNSILAIRRNGDELLAIVDDIQEFARVDSGEFGLSKSICCPMQILHDTVALMRHRAAEKSLTLVVRTSGDIPVQLRTDPVRLRQIMINLINFAIGSTYKSEIVITASTLDSHSSTPQLKLEVAEPAGLLLNTFHKRLSQPFTQAENGPQPNVTGSGLGLCISQKLAVALGGVLSCVPSQGQGSSLVLLLPVGEAEATTLSPTGLIANAEPVSVAVHPDEILAGYRVLFAEDGLDSQRLVSAILTKRGAEVSLVENGQLALLEALGSENTGNAYDVVLLDMQMPVMDGYTAARQLRRAGYTRPIIAVTANVMPHDEQLCLAAGCDDYLKKPIDKAKLVESILRLTAPDLQPSEQVSCDPKNDVHEDQPNHHDSHRCNSHDGETADAAGELVPNDDRLMTVSV